MMHSRRLVALVVLLLGAAEAPAQFFPPPVVPLGGFGVGVGYRSRNLSIAGFYGRSYYGYPRFGYPGWGYPAFGYGYPNVSVTYIYQPPPPTVITPPIIINNNINVNAGADRDERAAQGYNPLEDERFLKIVPRRPARRDDFAEAPQERPMPGAPAGRFRPAERVRPPAEPAPRKPAEMPKKPDRPADKPMDEYARHLAAAREAFAAGEYGRAERRLEQAARVKPRDPVAYFLLAQAQFALSKYREAVASIEEGMRLRPDWPGERFNLREPYGNNAADYAEYIEHLQDTLERHPDDFFLLFLRAYHLWFDGKQDEARALFQKALKVAPDRDKPFVNRFLMHGLPIARRQ